MTALYLSLDFIGEHCTIFNTFTHKKSGTQIQNKLQYSLFSWTMTVYTKHGYMHLTQSQTITTEVLTG